MYPPNAVVFDGDGFLINCRRYLSARDIARAHGYVRDYVTRLCRKGKVPGRRNENFAAPEAAHPTV